MAPQTIPDANEEVESMMFGELGLDTRLVRALSKKGFAKPTPIQRVAIPLILEGKDVVAQAKTGSGKTLAYLLPLLHKIFVESGPKKTALSAFVLVPTRELCEQVYMEASSLLELCRVQLKVEKLISGTSILEMKGVVSSMPDVLVSTPACISTCLSKGALQAASLQDSLCTLILDEADLLLSYGYEDDIKALTPLLPRGCQCILMSATQSADVEKLKVLVLHNPYTLTLKEEGESKDMIVPNTVQQFWISCSFQDKLLHLLGLLKFEVIQKKVLIFVNAIDMAYRLKLFLEQFGIRSAVLNAELPQDSRIHIIEEFNAGLFDYLIATDDSQVKQKEQTTGQKSLGSKVSKKRRKQKLDSEFGVVRGIDFKNVFTVINFEMPQSAEGYVHRIGRTGRADKIGASVSLVSPDEMEMFENVKNILGGTNNQDSSNFIAPFPLLTKTAVESLRYRAEDVAKSVTKIAVRESRAQDLRNEILNSEKLKGHFEDNPRDLDLLKHDKVLSKKPPPAHLQAVPEYLVDSTTKEASKMVKLARAAMGKTAPRRKGGIHRRVGKGSDPLKTFSAQPRKKSLRTGKLRRDAEGGLQRLERNEKRRREG